MTTNKIESFAEAKERIKQKKSEDKKVLKGELKKKRRLARFGEKARERIAGRKGGGAGDDEKGKLWKTSKKDVTPESETVFYRQTEARIKKAKENKYGIIVMVDDGETTSTAIHRLDSFQLARMIASIIEDHPEVGVLAEAMQKIRSGKRKW